MNAVIKLIFFVVVLILYFFWLAPSGVDFFYKKNTYHTCGQYFSANLKSAGPRSGNIAELKIRLQSGKLKNFRFFNVPLLNTIQEKYVSNDLICVSYKESYFGSIDVIDVYEDK